MANILPKDKQVQCIGALVEGSSICAISRLTGIHIDTITRLGVRVGKACGRVMDREMRNLSCSKIQMDEIWGFIGKKQKNLRPGDEKKGFGDVWTFVAIDAETKLVPTYRVGKRTSYTANCFVEDLASRLNGERVQVSSDALAAYAEAMERGFGANADYGQIVKTYGIQEVEGQRRYSPPEIVKTTRSVVFGSPEIKSISTSYIERQNLTMRMHMRRLTRLTNGFSKKLENFEAAVALHFTYYNFVRVHKSLRMTPAMAANVTDHIWSIADLVDAA